MGQPTPTPSELLASAARTATGTGDPFGILPAVSHVFILDLTAAATDGTDTLSVAIQTQLDGTNWVPIATFTAIDGTDSTARYVEVITPGLGQAGFEYSAALAAGSTRNIIGGNCRVAWTVVDGNAASFTFSVSYRTI